MTRKVAKEAIWNTVTMKRRLELRHRENKLAERTTAATVTSTSAAATMLMGIISAAAAATLMQSKPCREDGAGAEGEA